MRLHGTVLVILAVFALALAAGCTRVEKPSAKSEDKSAATGPADFLKQRSLDGRIALLQFGQVGCPLSEQGLARMAALTGGHTIADLAFLRVEASPQSKGTDRYFAGQAPDVKVYYDTDSAAAHLFDATAYPTYVLVDKYGHIRYRGAWPDEARLAEWVAALGKDAADPGPNAMMIDVATLEVQKLLAETALPDLKGEVKPLKSRLGPKGLLLVFVDTSCPFSGTAINEMPNVALVLAKHDVPSVFVNLGDGKDTVVGFYEKKQLTLPVVYDATTATQKAWRVSSVPTVVLADADGHMAYRGKAVWKELAGAAETMLKLGPGAVKFGVTGTEYG